MRNCCRIQAGVHVQHIKSAQKTNENCLAGAEEVGFVLKSWCAPLVDQQSDLSAWVDGHIQRQLAWSHPADWTTSCPPCGTARQDCDTCKQTRETARRPALPKTGRRKSTRRHEALRLRTSQCAPLLSKSLKVLLDSSLSICHVSRSRRWRVQ
jgi:hypothetical protein